MNGTPTILPPHGLEEVLGSAPRLRVTKLLVGLPEKEFTGREIARLLGMSHSTVQQALRSLVEGGLVTERVLGRAHVFRVSREHFLREPLAVLFRSEREQGRRIADVISAALAPCAISVVLFGSRAREGAPSRSDIDLLVVAEDVRGAESAISRLRTRLRRAYGLELDAKILTRDQLRSKLGAPFVKAARSEGLLLGGVPIEEAVAPAT